LPTLCFCVFKKAPTSCRSWCGDATLYDPLKVKVLTLRFIPLELVALKFKEPMSFFRCVVENPFNRHVFSRGVQMVNVDGQMHYGSDL
jgi:hypothetical protein